MPATTLRSWTPRALTGVLLALAACTAAPPAGPPPPARADSRLEPAAATAALIDALGAAGLAVDRDPSGLTVTGSDPRLALCDTIWVRERGNDNASRGHFARADTTRTTATIRIGPGPSGSTVTWQTRASGNYLDRFDNLRFDARCASSGELETLIAQALRG